MKYLVFIAILFTMQTSIPVYKFNSESKSTDWHVLDDVVMGGKSNGSFSINEDGFGVFKGEISLENNGGFSSVRHDCKIKLEGDFKHFQMRIKGDGKPFQFRVKSNKTYEYSYAATFNTTGEWETINIAFADMPAVFRGRKLDLPTFPSNNIEEIGFLIGNKKTQTFKLEIDSIILLK